MASVIYISAIILFILLCLILCFVILIQESKSSGLGASFGGDSSDSLFGTSTAEVLKKFTGWLAFIFFTSCVLLSFWTSSMGHKTTETNAVMEQFDKEDF